MKLKIHSVVDLITNSSTIIFTYSEGSIPALKELVNDMLLVFERAETFDDIFYIDLFLEEDYQYNEYVCENYPEINLDEIDLDELKKKILTRVEIKPQWMIDAENSEHWSGYNLATVIEIIPKDKRYADLANSLLKYLYSTSHEAFRDG